jgi:hypothetical protein
MKQILRFIPVALISLASTLQADDAERLSGKWSTKKVNDQGDSYTQTVEIKKDKFIFQILGADNNVVIYAEGDFKAEKLGPFNSARFFHVRGGQSSADLQDVDDDYTSIYVLDGDTWMLTSNFDKDRNQKPSLDVYHRVKATSQTGTLVIDEIEMIDTPQSATWYLCLEADVNGSKARYYVENKGYDKNQVTIPLALQLKAKAGQKCSFKLQLDDVDGDACTDEVDNRSTGEFTVSERGSQSYKPEDHWRYTIRWHIK